MIALLDSILERTTMYRVMLYFLLALLAFAVVFAASGLLPFYWPDVVAGAAFLGLACFTVNRLLAGLVGAVPTAESQFISALIMALIFAPAPLGQAAPGLALAALLAMSSKYLIAYRKRHIFNPAAFGIIVTSLLLGERAAWWVGDPRLVPLVIVGGLIVTQGIRRFHLVLAFLIPYLALELAVSLALRPDLGAGLTRLWLLLSASPLFFFTFVMLTEPITGPQGDRLRVYYGVAIAILVVALERLPTGAAHPFLLALLIGNVLARIARFDPRLTVALVRKEQLSPDIWSFWFRPAHPVDFVAGQYFEVTVPHDNPDRRGIRRFFTIASSPTEPLLMFAIKVPERPSSLKAALLAMRPGGEISASDLEGDFVLPSSPDVPCCLIAGGIGITPFRSMVKYLLDTNSRRPITLIYSNLRREDIAFRGILDEAERRLGLKVVYTLNGEEIPPDWEGRTGFVDALMVRDEVPDYMDRLFYVAGPVAMVVAMGKMLSSMGIPGDRIKRDYFPGYVEPA